MLAQLPLLEIPKNAQTIVYLVGMLGFPVVIALLLLYVLSSRLKNVDQSLVRLANRISETPMGLERTADFVIYVCESLEHQLAHGLYGLVNHLTFYCPSKSREEISRVLTMIRREVSQYLRPVFRSHQRFAGRFPSIGGNLGSLFVLSAPSEDIEAGQSEASLVGKTHKDPAEALLAIVMNNIGQFGNLPERKEADGSEEAKEAPETEAADAGAAQEGFEVIDKEKFLRLSLDAISTVCILLRDSMLDRIKIGASELERR